MARPPASTYKEGEEKQTTMHIFSWPRRSACSSWPQGYNRGGAQAIERKCADLAHAEWTVPTTLISKDEDDPAGQLDATVQR